MPIQNNLYTIPISERPPRTWNQILRIFWVWSIFTFCCIMINASQFMILLPLRISLRLSPSPRLSALHREGIRWTKGNFGSLLILMSQWFAPTSLSITFEKEGMGGLTDQEIESMLLKDDSGRVIGLQLPNKLVIIANHQMYADWWYMWSLTYFANMHKDVIIILKKSLKWAPLLGWGMQFYEFIFLARSWASDRFYLTSELAALGQRVRKEENPLAFIVYPEGTVVSKDTRPVSKKFADKLNIPDMKHCLMPRSTGLHYCLRSLSPRLPTLKLLDVTVVYPGIPPFGYGQSYYTIRSIFCDGIPPPKIHYHIRLFDVAKSIPIGDLSTADPTKLPKLNGNTEVVEAEIPEQERLEFEGWLRTLWRSKDKNLDNFSSSARFSTTQSDVIEIPLEIRTPREVLNACSYFLPVLGKYFWSRLTRST